LETELVELTGLPVRPKPTDFEVLQDLGEGNFTKVVKAQYKPTKNIYAIKVSILTRDYVYQDHI
jgi:hypothetical protein